MADRINELTLKLANFLLEENGGIYTFSISGFIAYLTLSLVHKGLRGAEKDNLANLLKCNHSFREILPHEYTVEYHCIDYFGMDEFLSVGSVQSAIFYSKPLVETFIQTVLETSDIKLCPIDPRNLHLQLQTIYKWRDTLRHITLSKISFQQYNDELCLMIVSEYYLHFKWAKEFQRDLTHKKKFTLINSQIMHVKMMRKVELLRYYDDKFLKASVIFLELHEKHMYAAVVLPYENNLKQLLQCMNGQKLTSWFRESNTKMVDLYLPKFDFFTKTHLKSFLRHYYLKSIFNRNQADLTGIFKNPADLMGIFKNEGFINDYIQISSISINEIGSFIKSPETAAFIPKSVAVEEQFLVNRPFIFYLYNSTNDLVLHLSVIMHPIQ
ncbi:Alpha-1-antitrypsin [Thelohanellus kitauei]|uniref:Alpha-1-antitrypsin n=1 Tax=Thelohanellus kitauei TaxID=669202 RepID=A0A0C2JIK3_THEKT|nr:Alpha-1-antitrypsin [Thelohanellus kitauei]